MVSQAEERQAMSVVKPYCWDVDALRIDLQRDRFFVIERLLEFGGDREIELLFRLYPAQEIRKVVMESREISPRTANYWCLSFEIDREQTRCFTMQSQMVWKPFS